MKCRNSLISLAASAASALVITCCIAEPAQAITNGENSATVESGLTLSVSDNDIAISKGIFWLNGKRHKVRRSQLVKIEPVQIIQVKDELITFTKDGSRFVANCSLSHAANNDLLVLSGVVMPDSVELLSEPGQSGVTYERGKDFQVDDANGTIFVTEDSPILSSPVYASYQARTQRLDTLVIDKQGICRLSQGIPARSAPVPAIVSINELPLAHILIRKGNPPLTTNEILPILSPQVPAVSMNRQAKNGAALEHTMSLIKNGKPLRIVFWGDSVTGGADSSTDEFSFVSRVISKFKMEYPNVALTVINAGKGGTNTNGRLPDFASEVLAQKPDLIVVEFVNDIVLPPQVLAANYQAFYEQATQAGAEIILVSPHLPSPNLLGCTSWDQTPAQVDFWRNFAQTHAIALADVTDRWQHLDREGLRADLMQVDEIIHPNDRGHEIYAEEIFKCF